MSKPTFSPDSIWIIVLAGGEKVPVKKKYLQHSRLLRNIFNEEDEEQNPADPPEFPFLFVSKTEWDRIYEFMVLQEDQGNPFPEEFESLRMNDLFSVHKPSDITDIPWVLDYIKKFYGNPAVCGSMLNTAEYCEVNALTLLIEMCITCNIICQPDEVVQRYLGRGPMTKEEKEAIYAANPWIFDSIDKIIPDPHAPQGAKLAPLESSFDYASEQIGTETTEQEEVPPVAAAAVVAAVAFHENEEEDRSSDEDDH